MLAVSLLVGCLCWDRGEGPSDTVTALPQGAAGAAVTSPSGRHAEPATERSGGTGTGTRAATTPAAPGSPARPAPPRKPGPSAPSPWKPAPPKSASAAPVSRPPGPSPRRPGAAPVSGNPTARAKPVARPAPRKPPAGPLVKPAPRKPPAGPLVKPAPRKPPARPVAKPPPGRHPALRPLPPSRATRLLIPYLRLDAPVMQLGLDREHRLTAPPEDDPKLVGWYQQGASPGEQGTAVAVGHLDTDRGPAVFAGLTELKPGRIVKARRADGRTAVYTVDRIKSYEKAHFPSQEVYGARGRPELRLITCGGTYDRRKGYSGNVVVFAHLTGIR